MEEEKLSNKEIIEQIKIAKDNMTSWDFREAHNHLCWLIRQLEE